MAGLAGRVGAAGASDAWVAAKANHARVIGLFLAQDAATDGQTWDQLSEATLCSKEIYKRFVFYLLNTYRIETGEHKGSLLKCGTVCNLFNASIQRASEKFNISSAAAATQRFFMCLEKGAGSAAGKWKLGVKANIERITFERAKAAGEQLDGSAGVWPRLAPCTHPTTHQPTHPQLTRAPPPRRADLPRARRADGCVIRTRRLGGKLDAEARGAHAVAVFRAIQRGRVVHPR